MVNRKDKKKLKKSDIEKLENTSIAGSVAGGCDGISCAVASDCVSGSNCEIDSNCTVESNCSVSGCVNNSTCTANSCNQAGSCVAKSVGATNAT